MGLFNDPAQRVNSRGDTLSYGDFKTLFGDKRPNKNVPPGIADTDPRKASEMILNWLTAGGATRTIDPTKAFADAEAMSPLYEQAGAGRGIAGLFGVGKTLGDMQGVKPLKALNPAAPLQPGVPYAAPAVPKMIGGG